MGQGFFAGILAFDPPAEIAAYPGPLMVAQGTRDGVVDPASARLLIDAHDGPESLWTRAMDHSFDAATSTEDLDALIAETIAFLDSNLR